MRKFIVFLALLAVFLISIVPAFAQERPNLVEVLEADGRFTTLVAAIDAAGLREMLTDEGPFTLLAPTDDAFTAALEAMGISAEDALADTDTLTDILLYHVIPGQYFFRNLTSGPTLDTALEGETVTFDLTDGVFTAEGVNILDTDNVASNGVMHVAEGVLVPPSMQAEPEATAEPTEEPTAAPTAEPTVEPTPEATEAPVVEAPPRPNLIEVLEADGRFTTLLTALGATGITETLEGEGPFTLLAPTDDAIVASLEAMGMSQADLVSDPDVLSQILLYHVIPGQYFFRNLTSGPTLDTLQGEPVTFDLTDGVFTAGGVNILDTDNVASNGVMHVAEGVLVPPSLQAAPEPEATTEPTEEPTAAPTAEPTAEATSEATEVPVVEAPPRPNLVEVLEADGRFTTLLTALEATGLTETLEGEGPFTLLAPTDDAFTAALEAMGISAEDALADTDTLTDILLYHVIPGQYFFRNLTSGPTLDTLQGEPVTFDLTDGVFTADGVNILDTDNVASNGVMHVAEGVLVPPSLQAEPEATAEPTEEPTAAPTAEPTAEPTPEATEVPVVEAPPRPNLVEVLEADDRFTTLVAAIDAAGLRDVLEQGGPFTLLAPTNDAFTAALEAMGISAEDALADTNTLNDILLYHVIPGQYFFRNLTSGPTLTTLEGQDVTFDLTDGVFTVEGVNILDTDNVASNGVMHVAEGVLIPPDMRVEPTPEPTAEPTAEPTPEVTPEPTTEPTAEPTPEVTPEAPVVEEPTRPNLVEVLEADDRFTMLVAAIDAAGLRETLTGEGPFTLLAPTNDAFAAAAASLNLTPEQVLADPDMLSQILSYHVIPGQYFFRNLTSGPTLDTLQGEPVTFDLTGGVFTAGGVNILDTDNVASNGVMHVAEGVLVPPSLAGSLAGNPRVRAAHFSPDTGAVDLFVNGAVSGLTDLAFPTVSDWQNLDVGAVDIGIAPADGEPIVNSTLDASEGDWVTAAVTGSPETLLITPLYEDFSPLAEGRARIGVFNGVEGSQNYAVVMDGVRVIVLLGYPGTRGDNDGYYYIDVPAGTYSIQFVLDASPSTVVVDVGEVALDAGTNTFVGAVGSTDAPSAVVVSSPVPAAE